MTYYKTIENVNVSIILKGNIDNSFGLTEIVLGGTIVSENDYYAPAVNLELANTRFSILNHNSGMSANTLS
jgi:hypothetical protein